LWEVGVRDKISENAGYGAASTEQNSRRSSADKKCIGVFGYMGKVARAKRQTSLQTLTISKRTESETTVNFFTGNPPHCLPNILLGKVNLDSSVVQNLFKLWVESVLMYGMDGDSWIKV
jgi:hypothetical protein